MECCFGLIEGGVSARASHLRSSWTTPILPPPFAPCEKCLIPSSRNSLSTLGTDAYIAVAHELLIFSLPFANIAPDFPDRMLSSKLSLYLLFIFEGIALRTRRCLRQFTYQKRNKTWKKADKMKEDRR